MVLESKETLLKDLQRTWSALIAVDAALDKTIDMLRVEKDNIKRMIRDGQNQR
jgi:hypothetical protein